jgi:hypothetical protein
MKGFLVRRADELLTIALTLAATTGCARREYFPRDGDGDTAAHLR